MVKSGVRFWLLIVKFKFKIIFYFSPKRNLHECTDCKTSFSHTFQNVVCDIIVEKQGGEKLRDLLQIVEGLPEMFTLRQVG